MRLLRTILLITSLFSFSNTSAQKDKDQVKLMDMGQSYDLIGELGHPLGTTLTVEGVIIDGPFKGYEGGPNLLVQKINDTVIQKIIRIPLKPYWPNWEKFSEENEPNIKKGETWSLRVYETGSFEGVPWPAYREANISYSTSGYYFRNELIVLSGIKLQAFEYNPKDFIGKKALISGISEKQKGKAYIAGSNWRIEIGSSGSYDKGFFGKEVEIFGTISTTDDPQIYRVENAEPRLIRLEDQLGKKVSLRGVIYDGGPNPFSYRGHWLYIEKLRELSNWSWTLHGKYVKMEGILEKITIPSENHPGEETSETYFTIKELKMTPLASDEGLLLPEVIDQLLDYVHI
ncbi:hypothetical protein [Gilvibacter sediminis]|uniref:hypothetical protein n=1 Tax=Gilvibacter sediminis TaxID=379071 RepID=UPI002350F355|nr:hypothetical protein [Gilvibacter sediminis]MDC7998742.1 hypothetical protein [Gilvibacter sediminis]